MPLLRFTGFETGRIEEVFSSTVTGAGNMSVRTEDPRTGAYSLRAQATASGQTCYSNIGVVNTSTGLLEQGTAGNHRYYGFGFVSNPLPSSGEHVFMKCYNGSGAEKLTLALLWASSGHSVKVYGGNSATLLGTISLDIDFGEHFYIEVHVDNASNYEVVVDDVSRLSGNDSSIGNTTARDITLGWHTTSVNGCQAYFDDIYIHDDTALGFLGSISKVYALLPTGAGDSTGWTAGTGTTFAEVDERPMDSDTTMVAASATQDNTYITFVTQTRSAAGISDPVIAVCGVSWLSTASTSGTSAAGARLRSGGVNLDTTAAEMTTAYRPIHTMALVDPATGAAWTGAAVDAAQIGAYCNAVAQIQELTACYHMVLTGNAAAGPVEVSLSGTQPASTGVNKVTALPRRGTQPAPSGTIARKLTLFRNLAGTQPTATGAEQDKQFRTAAGTQPAPSGILLKLAARTLEGAQPAPSGGLTRVQSLRRAVAGVQPAPSGALRKHAFISRAGVQPAPSATLAATKILFVVRTGTQPAATGSLSATVIRFVGLSGTAPASTGAVTTGALSLCKLVLADSADYDTATKVEQEVTSWTPNEIIFNASDWPPGPAWVFVVDADGNVSNGWPITIEAAETIPLSGAQPPATGTLTFIKQLKVSLGGTQPTATGAIAAKYLSRHLTGTQPTPSGTVAARRTLFRAFAGVQPASSGELVAVKFLARAYAGTQPQPTGELAVRQTLRVALDGSAPAASGDLVVFVTRNLDGTQPAPSGSLRLFATIALDGSQPAASGIITKTYLIARAGAQPPSAGALADLVQISRAGTQPPATGAIVARRTLYRALSGTQPTATGRLRLFATIALPAGQQPAPTGALSIEASGQSSLNGTQPSSAGGLRWLVRFAVRGTQPSPSGVAARMYRIARAGAQPPATGLLTVRKLLLRSLSGTQPFASGLLTKLQSLRRAFAGTQPPAAGQVAARQTLAITLPGGTQPAPAGTLSVNTQGAVTLNGTQPAATGGLHWLVRFAVRGTVPAPAGGAVGQQGVYLSGSQPAPSGGLRLHAVIALRGYQPAPSGQPTTSQVLLVYLYGEQPAPFGEPTGAGLGPALSGVQPAPSGTLHVFLYTYPDQCMDLWGMEDRRTWLDVAAASGYLFSGDTPLPGSGYWFGSESVDGSGYVQPRLPAPAGSGYVTTPAGYVGSGYVALSDYRPVP